MILQWLFGHKNEDVSAPLYATIVAAARHEKFYLAWQVPDTIDGRFEMLSMHMFLVINRLQGLGVEAQELSQKLTDRFFAEMDAALREVGVGDLSVGKKVRKMAEAYFGRAKAYAAALGRNGEELQTAIRRNVFAGTDGTHAPEVAAWMRFAVMQLSQQSLRDISAGHVRFE